MVVNTYSPCVKYKVAVEMHYSDPFCQSWDPWLVGDCVLLFTKSACPRTTKCYMSAILHGLCNIF